MGQYRPKTLGIVVAMVVAPLWLSGLASLPNSFTNGTVADADAINENFESLRSAVAQNSSFFCGSGAGTWCPPGYACTSGECVFQAKDGTSDGTAGASCKAILDDGFSTGSKVYWLNPAQDGNPANAYEAYCDMDVASDGGGWTLMFSRHGAQYLENYQVNDYPPSSTVTPSTTDSVSWALPSNATRWRWRVSTDSGGSWLTLITSVPSIARDNTWNNNAHEEVTLLFNSTGVSGANWYYNETSLNFTSPRYPYGIANGHSFNADGPQWGIGAITDGCGPTNDSEIYWGTLENVVGNGAGGSYCTQEDPSARWQFWWRDG